MPNKYEREIEEILRNMDRPEPKAGLGNRIRAFNRPRPRRPQHFGAFGLTACEVCLLAGILLILLGAGLRYFYGALQPTFFGILANDALSGLVALLGFAVFVVGLVIGWRSGFSGSRLPPTNWRSTSNYTGTNSGGSNGTPTEKKVVRIQTRRNRNPFSAIATRVRILRLKMRYQRIRDHEETEN